MGQLSDVGIPFLSPEVVLLYKAKNPTAVDQIDFENVCQVLKTEPRLWLKEAMGCCYPGHFWLGIL